MFGRGTLGLLEKQIQELIIWLLVIGLRWSVKKNLPLNISSSIALFCMVAEKGNWENTELMQAVYASVVASL